jgi:hypothetical protein
MRKFSLAEMRGEIRQSGRILLGDNNGSGAVMLRPVIYHCVEIRFKLDVHLHTHIVTHMCTEVQLLHSSTGAELPESK